MYCCNDVKVKVIYTRKHIFTLLNFSGKGFQPNTSSTYLPDEACFVKISGNFQVTLLPGKSSRSPTKTGPSRQ